MGAAEGGGEGSCFQKFQLYRLGFLLFLDPTDVQYLYFVKSVFFRNRLSLELTSNG